METWIQVLLGVMALVGPWIAGYYGTQRGAAVAMATYGVRIQVLEQEVSMLREAKHSHAQFLTRHEVDLEILMKQRDAR